jgi:2-polyprenyl-3-methyl-5-hydroxy-6-metoxy-1,4-benzoquinol methylase
MVCNAMTQKYYQHKAQGYFTETTAMTMSPVLEKFALYLEAGDHVLDVGCGSGRDSLWFLNHGFQVTAIDTCRELSALASEYIGQEVFVLDYQTISWNNEFEGIWACASLLHCPKSEIADALVRLVEALKPGGVFYMSFKHGNGEIIDDLGRFFNNYTMESLRLEINKVPEVVIVDAWENNIELRGENQTWVNAFVQKRG